MRKIVKVTDPLFHIFEFQESLILLSASYS
jgi:hypothetical protein